MVSSVLARPLSVPVGNGPQLLDETMLSEVSGGILPAVVAAAYAAGFLVGLAYGSYLAK